MARPDLDRLLNLVIEKANSEKTRIKELVDRFMNICVNGDEAEYESLVRTLMREGRAIVPELMKHFEEEQELKRKGILDMLGRVGDKNAVVINSIKLHLSDRHPAVRAQAAKAVAALAGPTTVDELIEVVETGKKLLMTRGALTTFSIANDVAKYFAIIPAIGGTLYASGIEGGPLEALNIMRLASPESAVLSAVIFNAIIIVLLIPLALRGVKYRAIGAGAVLRKNILIYGIGGLIAPFVGIKLIDILVRAFGLI
jgi:high-affinity K+ transport system ATPase subunit B